MKLLLLYFTLCFALGSPYASCACAATPAAAKNYRELIVVKQQIWGLTAAGRLAVYDIEGKQQHLPRVEAVTAQHIAADGDKVIAQIGPTLQRWNEETAAWETIGKLTRNVYGLIVTSQHQIFAIASTGVLNVKTGFSKLPASSPNDQLRQLTAFETPAAYFLDKQDNLWIGFGYGEWGGNIFTYDTRKEKFVTLTFNKFAINLSPIQSFFQFNASVGVSSGLQHMSNSGSIVRFQNLSAQIIYDSRADVDTTAKNAWASRSKNPYVGPATYEAQTDYLYFYASQGVFRGKATANLSKLSSWQLLFTPRLHWRSGQPNAVGSPMNVLRMFSLGNGKLVLLTQNDGLGIWDGSTFRLLP